MIHWSRLSDDLQWTTKIEVGRGVGKGGSSVIEISWSIDRDDQLIRNEWLNIDAIIIARWSFYRYLNFKDISRLRLNFAPFSKHYRRERQKEQEWHEGKEKQEKQRWGKRKQWDKIEKRDLIESQVWPFLQFTRTLCQNINFEFRKSVVIKIDFCTKSSVSVTGSLLKSTNIVFKAWPSSK